MTGMQKIIVVEDDIIIRLFLCRVIANAGFEVVGEAKNCTQVLELVERIQPDLIIMDIGIAGDRDGVETAEIINEKNNIPIMFITGNSDELTIERAKKASPIDFIVKKPIDEFELKEKLLQFKKKANDSSR